MATTTAAAIRDRIKAVIQALAPTSLTTSKFIAYRNEGGANFRKWAEQVDAAAFRRFQVRDDGDDSPPTVSNTDVEERIVTFQVIVAYPQNSRSGADNALDRDDLMKQDQRKIESAIGYIGRENFSSSIDAERPDACWRSGRTTRETDDTRACDFLVIEQSMQFKVSMT